MSSDFAGRADSPTPHPNPCSDAWVTRSEKDFRSGGLPKPIVHEVADGALEIPEFVQLYDYWSSFPLIDGVPHIAQLDPTRFRASLGNVMLIEPIEEATDFRYRLYGSNIAQRLGRDMTGKRVSEIDTANCVQAFFIRSYAAVMQTRRAYRTFHVPPAKVTVSDWQRLILPICNANGVIDRILVGNVAGSWRPVIDAAPYGVARQS